MSVSGVSSTFALTGGTISDNTSFGPLPMFETVTGAGAEAWNTIVFDLLNFAVNGPTDVGDCSSNAAFNSCTPANSAFSFHEDATGKQVTISTTMLLEGYTGSSATGTTPYTAVFSTQQSGSLTGFGACDGLTANITNIIACESNGGTIQATWSATESSDTTIPEPINFVLIGSGLLVLGVCARRSARRR